MMGLYRTFKQNLVPYYSDGRGRDGYIMYNNAGFFHNVPTNFVDSYNSKIATFVSTKVTRKNTSPFSKAPCVHYHSDGSGRDKYILINSGGLINDSKPLKSYKLVDFLRKDDCVYSPPKSTQRMWMTKSMLKHYKELRIKENDLINRLYHKERKKCIRMKNIEPLTSFSEVELEGIWNTSRFNKTNNNSFSRLLLNSERIRTSNNKKNTETNNNCPYKHITALRKKRNIEVVDPTLRKNYSTFNKNCIVNISNNNINSYNKKNNFANYNKISLMNGKMEQKNFKNNINLVNYLANKVNHNFRKYEKFNAKDRLLKLQKFKEFHKNNDLS